MMRKTRRPTAAERLVYRVQDRGGRGPWRPGFSTRWLDDSDVPLPPSFMDEFGWRPEDVAGLFRPGEFCGTACATIHQLGRWFTETEQERLRRYGYSIVMMTVERVIAESENQIVFARRKPLTQDIVVIPWPATIGR